MQFDRAGSWFVAMEIHTHNHRFNLGTHIRVLDPEKLAAEGAAKLQPIDFKQFRFNIGYRTLDRGSHPEYSRVATANADAELRRLITRFGSVDAIPATELAKATDRLENAMRDVVKNWTTVFGDKLK